jgi:hypothetical protein
MTGLEIRNLAKQWGDTRAVNPPAKDQKVYLLLSNISHVQFHPCL